MKKVLALTALLSSTYVGAMEFQQQEDFNKERVGVMTPFGGRVRSLSKDNISYPVKNIDEVKDAVKGGDKVKYSLTKSGEDILAVVSDLMIEEEGAKTALITNQVDSETATDNPASEEVLQLVHINYFGLDPQSRTQLWIDPNGSRDQITEEFPEIDPGSLSQFNADLFAHQQDIVRNQKMGAREFDGSNMSNDTALAIISLFKRIHGENPKISRDIARKLGYRARDVAPSFGQKFKREIKRAGKDVEKTVRTLRDELKDK